MLIENPIQPVLSTPTGWQGALQLQFMRETEQTVLHHAYAQAPLKIQRPFYPESPRICHSVLLHTAGGIVGGDRLLMNIHLQPEAQALITTAAASKLYRSAGLTAKQVIQITVDAGACLEWLPQETIVFNGARFQQHLRVELAENATWLGWEITRMGRSARGEQFVQGEWRSRTQVWQQGRLVWIDPQWLLGSETIWNSPHGLSSCPVVGIMAFIGAVVSPELVTQVRSLGGSNDGKAEFGVTRLMSGLLCRYRGTSTLAVKTWFREVWNELRYQFLGRSACVPRVWLV
jgi:urease accessory protein